MSLRRRCSEQVNTKVYERALWLPSIAPQLPALYGPRVRIHFCSYTSNVPQKDFVITYRPIQYDTPNPPPWVLLLWRPPSPRRGTDVRLPAWGLGSCGDMQGSETSSSEVLLFGPSLLSSFAVPGLWMLIRLSGFGFWDVLELGS